MIDTEHNVASLELCKELYKLSGWSEPNFRWCSDDGGPNEILYEFGEWSAKVKDICPAYSLGYLLRKLQPHAFSDQLIKICRADNPEDAACSLAIELIKQGVIKV